MPRTYASPLFQHRHYRAIAATLAKTKPMPGYSAMASTKWLADITALADMFAADNPRFDRERFLEACNGRPISPKDKVAS